MFKHDEIDIEHFDESMYPAVVGEVKRLHHTLLDFNTPHKAEVVISVLKDHCVKREWLNESKELVKCLTSGASETSQIESLFSSCQKNVKFRSGFEAFLLRALK